MNRLPLQFPRLIVLLSLLACSGDDSPTSSAKDALLEIADTWILFRRGEQDVALRPDGSQEVVLAQAAWVWSPDGSSLAAGVDGVVHVVDLNTGVDRSIGSGSQRGWIYSTIT
jgi:hypothetical protein